ncbi:MAG: hypothetical protein V2A73_03650, partial [Pseudomonadota bacterium]
IDLATRQVEIAGITAKPDGQWMQQIARNLTDAEEGFLRGKRYLILDRDSLYTDAFRQMLKVSGTEALRLPPSRPNLRRDFAEREPERWPEVHVEETDVVSSWTWSGREVIPAHSAFMAGRTVTLRELGLLSCCKPHGLLAKRLLYFKRISATGNSLNA